MIIPFFNFPKTKKDRIVYQLGRIFIFRRSSEVDMSIEVKAEFKLPEINKLAKEAKSGKIDVLFVSTPTGICLC